MVTTFKLPRVVYRPIESHPAVLAIRNKRQRNRLIRKMRNNGIRAYLISITPYPVVSLVKITR